MNTRVFTKAVAVSLVLCLGFNLTFPEEEPLVQVRTLDLSSLDVSDNISEKFE